MIRYMIIQYGADGFPKQEQIDVIAHRSGLTDPRS
jgi:hypothetical protein